MTKSKNPELQPVLNLGLSSLVESVETEAIDDRSDPQFDQAVKWIESEWEKNRLPKALILERLIELAHRANGAADPDSASGRNYQKLRDLAQSLGERVEGLLRDDFINRFEAAAKLPPEKCASNSLESDDYPSPALISELEPQSKNLQWQKFERIMQVVAEKSTLEKEVGVPPVCTVRKRYPAALSLVLIGIVALLVIYSSMGNSVISPDKSDFPFIHTALKSSLYRISDDPLKLPSIDTLDKVSSLSSLVSEINAQPPVTPSVKSRAPSSSPAQNAAVVVDGDGGAQEAMEKKPKQKEALSIEGPNEPEVVRAIQSQPEPAQKENTFDFPPFLDNRGKQTPAAEAPDVRVDQEGRAVIHFPTPRRYSITAATQIMNRPSYWAARLGIYDPGDMVSVDAVIGVWLRTRDEFGNPGYILSQDAAPEMRASR